MTGLSEKIAPLRSVLQALPLVLLLAARTLAQTDIPLTPGEIKVLRVTDDGAPIGDLTYSVAGTVLSYTYVVPPHSGPTPTTGSGTFYVDAPASVRGANLGDSISINPAVLFTVKISRSSSLIVNVSLDAKYSPASAGCQRFTFDAPCPISRLDVETTATGSRAYLEADVYVTNGAYPPSGRTMRVRLYFNLTAVGCSAAASVTAAATGQRDDTPACSLTGIDHLEIIQSVQDEKTSVPLIANKPTLVRVFIRMNVRVPNMTVLLHVSRGDKELSVPPLRTSYLALTSFSRTDLRKDSPDGSVDFKLPLEYLYESDDPLYVSAELKLPDVLPPGVNRDDPAYVPSGSLSRPLLAGRSEFRVAYMSFCSHPLLFLEIACPTDDIVQDDTLLRKTYPVSDLNVVYRGLSVPEDLRLWPDNPLIPKIFPTTFLYRVRKIFDSSLGQNWDQLIGYLPSVFRNYLYAGRAEMTVFKPRVVEIIETDRAKYPFFNQEVVAHEIAHNLGRHHTNSRAGNHVFTKCGDFDPSTDWPYSTPYIQELGWDSVSDTLALGGSGDLMSYCSPNWISPFTFKELLKNNLEPHSLFRVLGKTTAPRAASSGDQIIVSGFARGDGTGGALDPVYHVTSDTAAEPSFDGGSHCLRFSGPQGPLGDYCFQLQFQDPESQQPTEVQYFSLKAPFPDGATRIALVAGSAELAVLTAGSAPPAVTITSPVRGDRWESGSRSIAWSASDPDGKPLTYMVLYSSDGGRSWLPMAMDIHDPEVRFDPAQIDGGKNVVFRVLATSGVASTSVDVGPIEIVQSPTLRAAQNPLDFGRQLVGETVLQSLRISNPGSGPLNVSAIAIDNRDFEIVSGFAPLLIPAGGGRDIRVRWTVTAAGAQSATLSLSSNDTAAPVSKITLTGIGSTAGTPQIAISPAALDFKTVPAMQQGTLTVTITNRGDIALNLRNLTASGPFQVAAAPPLNIPPGGRIDVTVLFLPVDTSRQTGTLSIYSNDPAQTVATVGLSGTGGAPVTPQISVSPDSADFLQVPLGQSKDMTLTISNTGGAPLNVASVTLGGSAAFKTSFAPVTVAPGRSAGVTLTFRPAAAGAQQGTATIASDDPMYPTIQLNLTGTGGSGTVPRISVSPVSLNFGAVAPGQTAALKFTIGNSGDADLHVQSISQTGDPSFSVTPRFTPLTLAKGTIAEIAVQFAPTTAGSMAGSLSISSDDPDPTRNPSTVSLAGTSGSIGSGGCLPPPANVVSWWTGDGNAGDATGGNTLSVQGATTFAAGEVGQAFQFDGNTGYVSAGNPASLRLTSAITVEAWIYPRAAPAVGNLSAILTKWAQIFDETPASDSYGLWIGQDAGGANLFGAIRQTGGGEPHVQGGRIPLNAWTHVAMTFDSTTGIFVGYVNGVAVSTLTSRGAIVASNRNVFIGREDSIFPRQFNGLIDEVAVFGRALSASEIQGIYSAGAAGKCKPAASVGTLVSTPANLDFGSSAAPVIKTLTLRNTGASPITINAAPVTPAGAPFALVTGLPFTVAGNGSLDVSIRFTPTAAGTQSATLTLGALSIPLTGTGVAACVAPAANLVSWWTGDGNAGDSGGGNTLTVTGGTTFAAGQVGQAFQFDGSTGYASAGNPANLRLTAAITIEAWIFPRSAPAVGGLSAIVTKWSQIFTDTPDSDSYGLWLRQEAGGLNLFAAIHQPGPVEPHVQGGTIPLNAWTHVAMTFDSAAGQFVVYVNGQAVGNLTAPGPIFASGRNVFIGREDSFLPRPFQGLIDEVAVYSRALSAAEIQSIYTAGSLGKCKTTTGGTVTTTTLSVDANVFGTGIGLPGGAADNYFVNRLTPPGYPATLRQVQIVFGNSSGALPAGSQIRIVTGVNASGNAGINGIALTKLPGQVIPGQLNTFTVTPVTIASGDFVVGFETGYPAGVFPAVLDNASPPRLRSYFSTDGTTFNLLDAASGVPGNLGIRAVVDVGR